MIEADVIARMRGKYPVGTTARLSVLKRSLGASGEPDQADCVVTGQYPHFITVNWYSPERAMWFKDTILYQDLVKM